MKNSWKKTAAFLLAMALVTGGLPANQGTKGLIGSKGIVVYAAEDISDATVNLGAYNVVSSIKVGSDTISDLSGFDITYGTEEDHTAASVPTAAGLYYAYVTAKDSNTTYTGTAKSRAFVVSEIPNVAKKLEITVDNLNPTSTTSFSEDGCTVSYKSANTYEASAGAGYRFLRYDVYNGSSFVKSVTTSTISTN